LNLIRVMPAKGQDSFHANLQPFREVDRADPAAVDGLRTFVGRFRRHPQREIRR
jgi:hypothetical protein